MSTQPIEHDQAIAVIEREKRFLQSRLPELLPAHADQWVVVKDEQIHGFYTDFNEAYAKAIEQFGLQPFLLTQVRTQEPARLPSLTSGLLYAHL